MVANPVFGDLDQDGVPEYITGAVSSVYLASLAARAGLNISKVWRLGQRTGQMLKGTLVRLKTYSFWGCASVGDITGDGMREAIMVSAGYLVHAWDATGTSGWFPKMTGNWILGSPALGDIDGDGWLDMAVTTREGWLLYGVHKVEQTNSLSGRVSTMMPKILETMSSRCQFGRLQRQKSEVVAVMEGRNRLGCFSHFLGSGVGVAVAWLCIGLRGGFSSTCVPFPQCLVNLLACRSLSRLSFVIFLFVLDGHLSPFDFLRFTVLILRTLWSSRRFGLSSTSVLGLFLEPFGLPGPRFPVVSDVLLGLFLEPFGLPGPRFGLSPTSVLGLFLDPFGLPGPRVLLGVTFFGSGLIGLVSVRSTDVGRSATTSIVAYRSSSSDVKYGPRSCNSLAVIRGMTDINTASIICGVIGAHHICWDVAFSNPSLYSSQECFGLCRHNH